MSEKRTAANKKNALKSTGPKTLEGKARCKLNALKHGLRSVSLAVPVLEDPEDWTAHHDQVVKDLRPSGYLETVLSERAAALLWRLGRVVRYESEVVSSLMVQAAEEKDSYPKKAALEDLKERLDEAEADEKTVSRVHRLKGKAPVSGEDASLILDAATDALYLDTEEEGFWDTVKEPEGFPEELAWEEFDGWTRDMVGEAVRNLQGLANDFYKELEDFWPFILAKVSQKKDTAQEAYETRAAEVDRERRTSLLPKVETLDKVSRYESHLERALFRTLHELQRLQAARSGMALPPPAAVDLEVNVHQEAL